MAIEFVGSATATAINGGNPAVDLTALTGGIDTRPRSGDFIVGWGAVPSNTAGIDWSGYSNIDEGNNSANTARGQAAYKFSDGTETTATFTGDANAASSVGALVMVFRGVDTGTPQDIAVAAATGSSTNPDPPVASGAIVTNESVMLILAFSLVNDASIGLPTGFDGLTTVNAGGDTNDVSMAAAYVGGQNAGATPDPGAFQTWSTASWRALTIMLRPAATRIVLVGSTPGAAIDGANVTLDLTALTGGIGGALQQNDLVIVNGGFPDAATPGVSTAGFTTLIDQGTTAHQYVGYKVMGSSPDSSITALGSANAADATAYSAIVFRGVDPLNPIDVTSTTATGSSTTPDCPSITPVTNDCMIVAAIHSGTFGGAPVRPLHFNRMIFAAADDTSDATNGASLRTQRTAGAINPPSFTGYVSGAWSAATIALRPDIRSMALSKTLGSLTSSAAATIDISATATKTLGSLTASSTTTVNITGSLSRTLGTLTLAGTGVYGSEALMTLSRTLGALTSSAQTSLLINASASKTLGPLTRSAAATVDIGATLAKTLGSLTVSAAADLVTPGPEPVLAATLGALTSSGSIFKWDREADENDPSWTPQSGPAPTWTPQSGSSPTWSQQSSSGTWTQQNGSSSTWTEQ